MVGQTDIKTDSRAIEIINVGFAHARPNYLAILPSNVNYILCWAIFSSYTAQSILTN